MNNVYTIIFAKMYVLMVVKNVNVPYILSLQTKAIHIGYVEQ